MNKTAHTFQEWIKELVNLKIKEHAAETYNSGRYGWKDPAEFVEVRTRIYFLEEQLGLRHE